MSDWERAICARVKTIREAVRWPQSAFAEQIEIRRDQLASIEYGRTPLRYDIAWRLRAAFGISLRWLEEEEGTADGFEHDELPIPNATGLPTRALLSEVVKKFPPGCSKGLAAIGSKAEAMDPITLEVGQRWFHDMALKLHIEHWIARAPPGRVAELTEKLMRTAKEFMDSLPPESGATIDRRAEQLMWERIRMANATRVLVMANSEKKDLQNISELVKYSGVNSLLANLLSRLKRATFQRGKKTGLARFLRVPLVSVSRWLSGEREPGGETTLRILAWVQEEEGKQKGSPGRALTRPEPKTQRRKIKDEKPKSGPRRHYQRRRRRAT
jgi:transcriptional regulator with XRE-family HTH domain